MATPWKWHFPHYFSLSITEREFWETLIWRCRNLQLGCAGDGMAPRSNGFNGSYPLEQMSSEHTSTELSRQRARGDWGAVLTTWELFVLSRDRNRKGIVEPNPEVVSGSSHILRKSFRSLKSEDPLLYFYPSILSWFRVSGGGNCRGWIKYYAWLLHLNHEH